MTCPECERHERAVEQAASALNYAGKKIKRLDLMTYSEVREFDERSAPLRQALTTARSNRTRHRNKCAEAP